MTPRVPYAEVIGDPVSHSKSPLIHRTWLEQRGIQADYRATRVTGAELAAYLQERRGDPFWRGCNVTMPLKEVILGELDDVHRAAIEIGAVNVVSRGVAGQLVGRNSDVHGIWRALDGVALKGKRAVLLGTGGAARAAAYALRRAEVGSLHIVARSSANGEDIAASLFPPASVGGWDRLPAADLLINATPLGMDGTTWPDLPLDSFSPGATVFDMVYAPPLTPLLVAARQRGLHTIGGAVMLLHQAAESFRLFFEAAAPQETFPSLSERLSA